MQSDSKKDQKVLNKLTYTLNTKRLVYPPRPEKNMSISRQNQEKQVAFVFMTKGYGRHIENLVFKDQTNRMKYYSLLHSVTRGALRKLVDIMIRNIGQNIKPFQISEQRLLSSPLRSCRKWLPQAQQQTFFKIIRLVYGLSQENFYEDEIVDLYNNILKQLHKRTLLAEERKQTKKQFARKNNVRKINPQVFENKNNINSLNCSHIVQKSNKKKQESVIIQILQ